MVGIGTKEPARKLHISDDNAVEIIMEQTDALADFRRWNLVVDGGSASSASQFYIRQLNDAGNGGNVPLTISGTGRVIIKKLQLGHKWLLSGDRDFWADDDWLRLANTQVAGYWGGFAAGKLYSVRGTVEGSDLRLKTEVSSLNRMLDKLLGLRGVRFKWRDGRDQDSYRFGLIAQEAENVLPEVIETGPDGMKGINESGLVAGIITAMKELQSELNSLRAECAPRSSCESAFQLGNKPAAANKWTHSLKVNYTETIVKRKNAYATLRH